VTAVELRLPWMSRSDRRRWRSARTVSDLGELMALWLEGKIASRPGYQPRYGPEDETAHLVPTLAALCRAGYVTTQSQPGLVGTGTDGLWWEQRAAVELVVTDPRLVLAHPPRRGGRAPDRPTSRQYRPASRRRTPSAGRTASAHRRLEDLPVLIPRPRRRIGRPRPQRPGPRYPHRPARLPSTWWG